ncbi:MAG TPA: class I adenylate-forming enzyme family protein [Acidimicrobiales bacterium]|nr:class I adenylate-forming enzyme family protein [Acidimicrobiales bacterium]
MTAPAGTFAGPPLETEAGIGSLTLGGLLRETAARHRDREAIAFPTGDGGVERWDYGRLEAESRKLAKALVAAGVDKGTRVALLMGNRPEWVAACFGVALAGGVLVPLNTFYEPRELAQVLGHCDAALLLSQHRLGHHDYEAQLGAITGQLPHLRRHLTLGTPEYDAFLRTGDAISDAALADRSDAVSPYDDAVIIYTSGSTGMPKGVLHAHRPCALQSWRFAQQLRLDPSVRVWSAFPFFWTAGFCMVMGATLAAGGCLVLQELFDPGEALALLESERVTSPHAWPHQLAALEDHPSWEGTDLSSLRHVVEFTSFGRHPTVHVGDVWSPRAAYGLTETFTIISSLPADTPASEREGNEGIILPGNVVRIVDRETGVPLPAGAPGEIRVKGPTLMKGYLKVAPEEVFDTDGFFPTGDAGMVDDEGRLHWLGRTDDLIKTGGANVSPVEIETELLHHPDLHSALAVGVPHDTLGQVVVVCAVAHPGRPVDEDGVRAFLRGRLASYKIPRHVLFFDEADLVMTGNAKIKVEELRRLATARLALSVSPEPSR